MAATRPALQEHERPLLEQLADIIGEAAAVLLSVRFGGRRLYIPKDPIATSDLVGVIGLKASLLLARRFGGVHLEMPLERGKRERIVQLSNGGKTVREIAEAVGCTERHVKYVRAEYREHGGLLSLAASRANPDQHDLFRRLSTTTD
jgi:Homeodomain-like domain